ncbi:hypothetical protein WA1_16650 [Scytonema hofmannii PCC 7110]|uniref:Uncharacterized protein n=2 Tax=Scytonema hofmannii TaxID=34078 RepID=A0A139XAM6_9CYAN|nr:hypothetical protein WA1_16650 [Scytonema hofmannii PCC 7110]
MGESTVKLIIALQDSDLDEEELDKLTKNLLQEIKDLDDIENPCLAAITQTPQGTKLFGSFHAGDVAG